VELVVFEADAAQFGEAAEAIEGFAADEDAGAAVHVVAHAGDEVVAGRVVQECARAIGVVVEAVVWCDEAVIAGEQSGTEEALDHVGHRDVVGVEEEQELGGGMLGCTVSCSAWAEVGLTQESPVAVCVSGGAGVEGCSGLGGG
jgi:hypothetical protein